jgi:hypothetical protein
MSDTAVGPVAEGDEFTPSSPRPLNAGRPPRRGKDAVNVEVDEDDPGRAAVKQVAAPENSGVEPAGPDVQKDALDWFLSADQQEFSKKLRLNVGGPVDDTNEPLYKDRPPVWIEWVVRPLDLDTIKALRRRASGSADPRRRRRQQIASGAAGDEFDDTKFNLGIVAEATVVPDMKAIVEATGIQDVTIAIKQRFANKSGLIGQIVGEVLDLSGYNENDVQDANEEVLAAGN